MGDDRIFPVPQGSSSNCASGRFTQNKRRRVVPNGGRLHELTGQDNLEPQQAVNVAVSAQQANVAIGPAAKAVSVKRELDDPQPQQAVNVPSADYVNVASASQQVNVPIAAAKPVKREVTGQDYVNIAAFAPQQVNVPIAAKAPVKREVTGQDYYVNVAFAPQQAKPVSSVKCEVTGQDYVNVAFGTQQANFATAPPGNYVGVRRVPWREEEHELIVDAIEEFIRSKFPQHRVANFRGFKSGLWRYVKQRSFAEAHHRTEQSIHQRFDKLLEEAAKPPIKRLLPMSLNLANRILAVA